ncbi:heme oxygenase-like protein [Macroventuria anomochaeta]|uniref:Heme oxygenase-like protein n=1 Tax=Macroventuria anomochaeta TaxID=301207 RepID=A0ACB6RP39_9PLEO|nr:heme oxygenase-like protein [Macroventuria anomochaeta]KAF2623170.1 heme oxygenase-like protein [Macroventuria anomochaeta]
MGRHANPDIRRAFVEFQDADTPSKCNKVRCQYCGFVRAKNTTRQIEHLQECQAYINSPDAQAHMIANQGSQSMVEPNMSQGPSAILNGQQPNPNLQVHRRGPNTKRARDGQPIAPNPMQQHQAPSLTNHLLATCSGPFAQATQQPFLSHAGCGSLAAGPLSQWLVQDGHYSRGYIRFVGQLLAKIRLPQTQNSQFHPMYRTMDLLISALNNMRREMQFFEITATKYGLALGNEPPSPITRALLDLFVSASSSCASLLEGMVVLWGTEHCYRSAWQYAASFSNSLSTPSNDNHIVALHQALIPNWTSPAFNKFVDATRALVDELANTTTARDGKEEMQRCDEIFRQICWLEQRFWPEVDGMGEEDDGAQLGGPSHMGTMGTGLDNGMNNSAISSGHIGNQNMDNGSMNGGRMNSNAMNSNMGNNNMNGPMGSQMNRSSMNGPIMGGQGMNNQNMSGQGVNGSVMSGDDGTPGNDDGRNNSMFSNSGLEGQGP